MRPAGVRFAKWVFLVSGVTGILITLPPYFLEEQFGRDHPPPVNHAELYYGFFGVTFAWQIMFLLISSDPVRYRPAMVPALIEKASFAFAVPILYWLDRVSLQWVAISSMDAIWLMLFGIAFARTSRGGPKNGLNQ